MYEQEFTNHPDFSEQQNCKCGGFEEKQVNKKNSKYTTIVHEKFVILMALV